MYIFLEVTYDIFLFFSTISSPLLFSYDTDEDMSEIEYVDPYEGEGPISSTPPPSCNGANHKVCVPPAWGERIPGPVVKCRCLLCHEEGRHHAIRCIQCGNAPGCCACIWGYMRSQYNSGCPLCRHGDPCGKNPLGADLRRIIYRRRGRRMVSRRGSGGSATMATCGIGRGQVGGMTTAAGNSNDRAETTTAQRGRRGRGAVTFRRGRGRRGRGTTVEEEKEEKKE